MPAPRAPFHAATRKNPPRRHLQLSGAKQAMPRHKAARASAKMALLSQICQLPELRSTLQQERTPLAATSNCLEQSKLCPDIRRRERARKWRCFLKYASSQSSVPRCSKKEPPSPPPPIVWSKASYAQT